jgi:hypothetical protein
MNEGKLKKVSSQRKTKHQVLDIINEKNFQVELINMEYRKGKGGRTRLFLQLKCIQGHEYEQLWDNFKKGHGCLQCSKLNIDGHLTKYTYDYVVKTLYELGYALESEYKDSGTSFTYKCLKCGNQAKSNFGNIVAGRRCGKCANVIKKTTNRFKENVFDIVGDEYEVLGQYEDAHTKIELLHKKCDKKYNATPHNFLMGRRCPNCIESRGETEIASILDRLKINYIKQYRFDDCRNILPLPFDFALFGHNSNLLLLIEYDGQLHYELNEYFGGRDGLLERKRLDKIKTEYCLENKLKLLRIPYWDFDRIEEIIKEEVLCQTVS